MFSAQIYKLAKDYSDIEKEVKVQRYVIPSDKDGYVDTFEDNEVADGNFVTEQHRWEDSKLDYAVMKFGAKDAKKVCKFFFFIYTFVINVMLIFEVDKACIRLLPHP